MRPLYAVLLCSITFSIGIFAQDGAGIAAIRLQPGVWVEKLVPTETTAPRLFAMHPEGKVVAYNLQTGAQLWVNQRVHMPLGLVNGHLLTYREGSRSEPAQLVFLNPNDGTASDWEAADVPFPQTAWKSVDDGLGRSLRFDWATTESGQSLIWQTKTKVISALPPGLAGKAPDNEAVGALSIDVQNGTVTPVASAETALVQRPVVLASSAQRVNTQRGRQFLSADGNALLVSTRVGDDRIRNKYRWTIYDANSKAALGSFAADISYTSFVVLGKTLVFVARPFYTVEDGIKLIHEPMRLRIIDLSSGKLLWEQAIRDTEFRGPYPP